MSIISGVGGLVANGASNITGISKWSIASKSSNLQSLITSASAGAPVRVAGNDDWNGSYEGGGPIPGVVPGESITFKGSIDGVKGVSGAAIVDGVTINWDIEGGKPISHSVRFSGNGALTLGAEAAVEDTGVEEAYPSKGTKLMACAPGGTPAEVLNVRTMELTMTCDNPSGANSSTAGVVRRAKGNFDATFTATLHADDFSVPPQPGTVKHLRLFVNATDYWEIKWMVMGDLSNCEVDRETGAPVGCSISGAMTATTDIAGTPTLGEIVDPNSSTVWPEA